MAELDVLHPFELRGGVLCIRGISWLVHSTRELTPARTLSVSREAAKPPFSLLEHLEAS